MTTNHQPRYANSSSSSQIRRVISACSRPDITTWAIVAKQVLLCIPASEYLLICPSSDIAEFSSCTPAAWTIVDDESLCRGYGYAEIHEIATGTNQHRTGWLLQQFLKINACADPLLEANDLVLIWDADTIPLRLLRFSDEHNRVIQYYHSREHHTPYFETIQRILNINTFAASSFIAQCFATRVSWTREFIDYVEQRSGGSYIQHIVRFLPGVCDPEFSEYETLGTWNLTYHADQIAFIKDRRWTRSGARWIGHEPEDAITRWLLRLSALRYDYVAVEKWQRSLRPSFLSLRLPTRENPGIAEPLGNSLKKRMSRP